MRALILALLLPILAGAQPLAPPAEGDARYRPRSGQAGKDVIWVPTSASMATAMLEAARVRRGEFVVDLGSGDGRIAIAAAQQFGAWALGIEYDARLVALARRAARRAGVADRVRFVRGDLFKTDFGNPDVVTLYLLPELNLRLRPTLLDLKPGTRIVGNAFGMGDWRPDRTIHADDAVGYLWVVPAQLEGVWAIAVGGEMLRVRWKQRYQTLIPEPGAEIREGRVDGLNVTLTRANGQTLRGRLLIGTLQGPGWSASRVGV